MVSCFSPVPSAEIIQSWFFPVRFDSNRIRGALGDTSGNPPFTTGVVLCARDAGARSRKRAARVRETRDMGWLVGDCQQISRYGARNCTVSVLVALAGITNRGRGLKAWVAYWLGALIPVFSAWG